MAYQHIEGLAACAGKLTDVLHDHRTFERSGWRLLRTKRLSGFGCPRARLIADHLCTSVDRGSQPPVCDALGKFPKRAIELSQALDAYGLNPSHLEVLRLPRG